MSTLGELAIKLGLDSVEFQQGLTRAEHKARKFADRTVQYLDNIERAAKNINNATQFEFRIQNLDRLRNVANTAFKVTDEYTQLANKLQLVTESEAQHAKAMVAVYDISLKTAQSSQATSSVYQTFAQNAKELGLAQADVARLTETVSKAVAISGASSATASNALVQFSQSLLMGKMKAQEFNSLMTQTPSVVQAIAKGLGVTTAELKEMVDKGELSAQKMVEGLKKAESSVNDLYGKTSTTISGAMQNLATATEKWVGETDKAIGVSNGLANATNFLATNLDTIAPVLLNVGAAWAAIKLKERVQETYNATVATQQKARSAVVAAKATLSQSQSELVFARSAMQSLQAQLQLARTEQERTIIRQRMKAQSAEIIALTNAERAATQNLANAKKSANLLNGAMSALGGPIGLVTMGLTFGVSALWEWYQSAERAKQKNLDFVQSLDSLNHRIKEMSTLELKVASADTRASIDEQKKKIKELEQEFTKLEKTASEKTISVRIDWATGRTEEFEKSLKTQQMEMDAVNRKALELKQAKDYLARTEASLAEQMNQVPIAELRDRFAELFPNVEQSQIKVDGLNVSVGNFTFAIPSATTEALNFAGAIGTVAATALQAAVAVANFQQVSTGISADAQKIIDRNSKQLKIQQLEKAGNFAEAAKLKAELQIDVDKFQGADFDALMKSYTDGFLYQYNNKPKGGGNPKKPKKTEAEKEAERERKKREREAEKERKQAVRESEKSREDYQKQFGEMSYRLSELKANTKDIEMFGQVSQYQEVKKLTEDIALNAEKYKNFGLEGIEQLKSLSSQIDGEHQKLEIAKFGYDNTQKIKAIEFELTLLGKTRSEQELLQYGHQLEQEAAKLRIGMTEENIAKLDEEIAKLKERYSILQQEQERKRSDPVEGVKAGWSDIENSVTDVAGNMQNITVNAFNNMSDALTDFVLTGKGNFRDMATSILKDIAAMTVKMMLFNAIKSGMSAFGGFSSGGFVGGDFATGGYTGDGGKFTPAGIVHKGEYVITKEATSRIGLDYLNYLNYGRRGFASGGGVAVPRVPSINHQLANNGETHNSVTVTVNIDKNGNAESSVEQQAQQGKQLGNLIQAKVLEVLSRERRAGGMLAH